MRDKIIEKSTEMFLIRGSKGLTMDTIAYEMGISKKTIYKYLQNHRKINRNVPYTRFEGIDYGYYCV